MNVGAKILTFAEPRAACGATFDSASISSIRTRCARENLWKRDHYRSSEGRSSFENRQLATQDGHNAKKKSVELSAKRLEHESSFTRLVNTERWYSRILNPELRTEFVSSPTGTARVTAAMKAKQAGRNHIIFSEVLK